MNNKFLLESLKFLSLLITKVSVLLLADDRVIPYLTRDVSPFLRLARFGSDQLV